MAHAYSRDPLDSGISEYCRPHQFIRSMEQSRRQHVPCFLSLFSTSSVGWKRGTADEESTSTIRSLHPIHTSHRRMYPASEENRSDAGTHRPSFFVWEWRARWCRRHSRTGRDHGVQSAVLLTNDAPPVVHHRGAIRCRQQRSLIRRLIETEPNRHVLGHFPLPPGQRFRGPGSRLTYLPAGIRRPFPAPAMEAGLGPARGVRA
jgi:hypothetical protein